MKKLVASIFFFGLLFGANGKITGIISQKVNGDPAVGVNIILIDSYLGAATDANGRFIILNIPPGTYSLRADAIGRSARLLRLLWHAVRAGRGRRIGDGRDWSRLRGRDQHQFIHKPGACEDG